MNFDLTNAIVDLRIICGLFFIPHALAKITAREAVFGFFTAAGFKPVAPVVYFTMVVEWIVATCLILGLFTHYMAWAAAFFMVVASAAVFRVSKGRWLWNLGGFEYTVFWGLCCVIVATHS